VGDQLLRTAMVNPTGGSKSEVLRLDFDRRLMLQFRGSAITSDVGLLAYRELDDTLQRTDTAADMLADARTGKSGRHRLAGPLRQSVFGRLAGYEDVNDADRLYRDPAMGYAANRVLQDRIVYLLKRPVGRPPHQVRRFLRLLRVSGAELEQVPPRRGQGRPASRRDLTHASGSSSPT
jgi:Transposase DDE domain group 1